MKSVPVSPTGACNQLRGDHERQILTAHSSAIIARTDPLFGWEGQRDPIGQALRALAEREPFLADDVMRSPAYAPDFAHAALDLLLDGERGGWHLASTGSASWFDLVRPAAELAAIDPSKLTSQGRHARFALGRQPRRILESERGWLLRELDDALARHLQVIRTTPERMRGVMAA